MRQPSSLFSAVIQRKGHITPLAELFGQLEIRDIPYAVRQKTVNAVELNPSFAFFRYQMCIAPPAITCVQEYDQVHVHLRLTTPIKIFLSIFCSVMMTFQVLFFTPIGREVAKKAAVLRYFPGIIAIVIAGATLLDFFFTCRSALRELKEAIDKNDRA